MNQPLLQTPIEFLKGVGPSRAETLRKELDIDTYADLLNFYPLRYIDRTVIVNIADIRSEAAYIQVRGKISCLAEAGAGRAARLVITLEDETGEIELVWFQGIKWVKDKIKTGVEYLVFGKPSVFGNRFNIIHPEIEPLAEARIIRGEPWQPVYSTTEKLKSKGLHSKGLANLVRTLLTQAQGQIPEILPQGIVRNLQLVSREQAIVNIHYPTDGTMLEKATKRLKFDELFFNQLPLLQTKQYRNNHVRGFIFSTIGHYFNTFYSHLLHFDLTGAQKRVLREIRNDTGSGRQMNRLLQGDVGSGKTVVALMTMLMAADNGFQACLMAPTEILATQHYQSISRMLSGLEIKVELLTGSTKASVRAEIQSALIEGLIKILIGTHALIEETVQFHNLGVVIIDEQHRFGVEQRARLWQKSIPPPHVLVMTATPIPRTLAMTLHGDLDYSVIDEMPPGRKPVKTVHYYDQNRLRVFGFMKEQIRQGRQVYVVYPLINESETLDLKDLVDGYDSIVREFPLPEFAVSIVHGQMKSADRDFEMQRFVRGETNIMVATTVIEVGVDVPNASVMVIESAERFGLAQLHQLRGRVGRGADQSFCILMTKYELSADAKKRISTMVRTNDGFEIANVDLQLRGPGEIQGTRQSGGMELRLVDLSKDGKILDAARKAIGDVLAKDPELKHPENLSIINYIRQNRNQASNWVRIS